MRDMYRRPLARAGQRLRSFVVSCHILKEMSTSTHLLLALATFCIAVACKKEADAPRGKRLAPITEEEIKASLLFEQPASIVSPAPDPEVPAQPILIGRRERTAIDTSYSRRAEQIADSSAVKPPNDTASIPAIAGKSAQVVRRTIDFHLDANGVPLYITNGTDTLLVVPTRTEPADSSVTAS